MVVYGCIVLRLTRIGKWSSGMARTIKVASAQTGSVESEDMSSTVPRAVKMIEEAAAQGVQMMTFCELFLSPFFPNRLIEDNDRFFTEPTGPVLAPILEAAKKHGIAL